MKYSLLFYKGQRPDNCQNQLKKELIKYLQEEYKKKHIPSRRELQKKFHMNLTKISKNINCLYRDAGLKYKLVQNQSIKSKKAEILLKLILDNLKKFEYGLVKYRRVNERGIDIVTKKGSKIIGIELKAYNKYEKLKQRDINQVKKFIKKERLNEALIITTTDLSNKKLKIPDNLEIIRFKELKKFNFKEIKKLNYIRDYSINIEDTQKEVKRQKILNYVLSEYKTYGKKVSYNEILKNLHLDIYTYFKNLFEIYKILKIPPSLKNMSGKGAQIPDIELINLWKDEFKKYILEEIKKGKKYPSGEEIAQHFGISHIWNIVNVSELYGELRLKPYLERKTRKFTSSLKS